MQDDDKKHRDQFDASLPLPMGDQSKDKTPDETSGKTNPAADLVRKRLARIYAHEPDAGQEIKEVKELEESEPESKLSKHQKFIMELTDSQKSLSDIQTSWHDYYAGLNDKEKHEVWQEFYNAQSQHSHYKATAPKLASRDEDKEAKVIMANQEHILAPAKPHKATNDSLSRTMGELKDYFGGAAKASGIVKHGRSVHHHLKSLAFGLSVGSIVLLILLFGLFNERIIAPFIQPSRNVSNTPIISTTAAISPNSELIIPKINVQIPIVYAADNSDDTIETDLESGVVHYADTATPGNDGNLVIFGHSSNNIFNPGKYKFAFVLLSRLDSGDTFYIDNGGKRYTYEVYDKKIVSPSDVSVLGLTDKPATATLITCDPPGTSINRLVVTAEQIDPSSSGNGAATTNNQKAISQTKVLPSNSPTLWSRVVKWLES